MRVGIVGAGMAGLAAGRQLVQAGHEAVVFEKSRGLGGRAATRRRDGFVWDTGATAIPEEMLPFLPSSGLVRIERPVWLGLPPRPGDRSAPRYAYRDGMNALGKLLAEGLEVRREVRIESLARKGGGFEMGGEGFDALVLTPPIPQTRALLETLGEARPLAEVVYRPCLSVLLGFAAPLPDVPYSALLTKDDPMQWISLESAKSPGRAPEGHAAIVCQLGAEYSEADYAHPPEDVVAYVCGRLASILGPAFGAPVASDVMRWRYSQPTRTGDFDAANPPGTRLLVASDGLTGGKLHHAYAAGQRAANRLIRDE